MMPILPIIMNTDHISTFVFGIVEGIVGLSEDFRLLYFIG
jgi:hypothetical protein